MSSIDTPVAVLEVTISARTDHLVQYQYDFRSPPTEPTIHLQADALVEQARVDKFCAAAGTIAETAVDHRGSLRSTGTVLYRLVFPESGRGVEGLRRELRNWAGPLIVKSEGSPIPWELLHDGDGPGDGEFFGMRFSLGRQRGSIITGGEQLGRIERALLVSDPTGDLPKIHKQTLKLREFLKGAGIECTMLVGEQATELAVLPALGDGAHDFFHYAGHVVATAEGGSALVLSDGLLVDRAIAQVVRQAPPAVFLIGCESVQHLSGLGEAFQNKGARIVVGTIYEPSDGGARDVAENFYFRLGRGATAGAALQEARDVASKNSDGSWAAFVLLGDPTARFWPDEPEPSDRGPFELAAAAIPGVSDTDAAATTAQASLAHDWWARRDLPGQLDPNAALVITAVINLASAIGLVTSWHLAVALLGDDDSSLAAAATENGLEPAALAEMLSLSFSPDDGEGASAPGAAVSAEAVELSDNARLALTKGAEAADEAARAVITVEDLVRGFMGSGGGTVGDVLALLGITAATTSKRAQGSIFDDSDRLRAEGVSPSTLVALRLAKLLSATQNQMISSMSTMMALALAGSGPLREALLEQGTAGARAVKLLVDEGMELAVRDFSARSFNALEAAHVRALAAREDGVVDDAELLIALLNQDGSSAAEVLNGLGIDADQLRRALATRREAPPEDEAR